MDLSKFGTPDHPLRASRLERFLGCPWREVTLVMGLAEDRAGEAADTGSAVHAAVSTWHRTGHDAAAAVEAMRARLAEYPLADMQTAASLFLAYATDPGNLVDLVLNEKEVTVDLPTEEGAPVRVLGHVDQVRRAKGRLETWDVKTSKKPPHEVLWSTCVQAAAYCKAAARELGEPVHPGGVIMPRRSPMHIPFTWTINDIDRILEPVALLAQLVRRGHVWHKPEAETCRWCHMGGPDACLPRLRYELPMVKS